MALVYENRVSKDFISKVKEVSNRLSINPNWLMQVMKSESGLSPSRQNPIGGATGLIQFMPSTAANLGTTTWQLKQMTGVQQLEYVYKYFKPFKGKIRSYYDLYLVTFFPAAIGKPDSWVFESKNLSASSIAKQNPGININKDNKITIAEFKQYLQNTVEPQNRFLVFGSSNKNSGDIKTVLVLIIVTTSLLYILN